MTTVLDRLASPAGRVAAAGRRGAVAAQPITRRMRPVLATVSGLGWTVLAIAVVGWILGRELGWQELILIATAALFLVLGCALFVIGRTSLSVTIDVEPQRVTVGSPSTGTVSVRNTARGVLLPIVVEVPVGRDAARFNLPLLRHEATHDDIFVMPTAQRGVIPVGPAQTVRGDPLGLLRRTVSRTAVIEVFVHPLTVHLDPLTAGLLRDLEGQTSEERSVSDLAFHTLREYVPGDDRRHIHWRSSAKAGRFLVRQFLDTRRSHYVTVLDSSPDGYGDADDFETAISVAASVAVRATLDEQDISVVTGGHAQHAGTGARILDIFSRAELGAHNLLDLSVRASRVASGASLALLITGRNRDYRDLLRAAAVFPPEVRVAAIRIDADNPSSIGFTGGVPVLSLRTLSDLPVVLAGGIR